MITEEEYNKWAPLVAEYEESLAADALANSLYCTSCHALEAHDCFCDDDDPDDSCSMCGTSDWSHHQSYCPYHVNNSY